MLVPHEFELARRVGQGANRAANAWVEPGPSAAVVGRGTHLDSAGERHLLPRNDLAAFFLAFNLIIDQTVTDSDRPRARPHPCPRVLVSVSVSVSAWHCYPAACHGNVSSERAHIVWIVITNNRELPFLLLPLPLPVLVPLLPIMACLPLPAARLCRHVDVKLLSSCGLNGSAENLAGKMKKREA